MFLFLQGTYGKIYVIELKSKKGNRAQKGRETMSITIDFTPADVEFIAAQAAAGNVSLEEFSKQAILKAAQNAAYLSMLDKSRQEAKEGRVIEKTMEELEAMAAE